MKALVFTLMLLAAVFAEAKPNVVFILTDDLGFGDVGFTLNSPRKAGEAHIDTPFLDSLAREGVRLTDHYCAAPVCAPSRASILTGMPQPACSVKDNMFDHPITETNTIATVMKAGGYHTYAVGKWGVGGGGESGKKRTAHPCDRGFDHYYGFLDHLAGHTYFHSDTYKHGVWQGIDEDRTNATASAVGKYSTCLFTEKAKAYISDCVRDHRGEPFFLYLAYTTVHGPFEIPGEPYPQYRELPPTFARYATCVTILDEQIKALMDHLEQLGVLDDTVVIFTSDNGPAAEYGSNPAFFRSAGPFRGKKRDVLEGGMRVPTFVWRKGGFAKRDDPLPSISVDWLPTLAELAGVKAPAECPGTSLWPRWTSADPIRDQDGEIVRGSLISTAYRFDRPQSMARCGDYVSVRIGAAPVEVYNVRTDPGELTNLVESAVRVYPWSGKYPAEVVREWIDPDRVLEESLVRWRPVFADIFPAMVENCRTATEAVQTINAKIWDTLGVHYTTKRDAALQHPLYSMATKRASCTGMAILQICAYRSVGIPARLVGCNWTTIPGNHSWVEFMDERGEWHFFGDGDPSPIDDSWIAPFAAAADASRPDRRIYASRATPNADKTRFWRTWALPFGFSDVWADDVTARYRRYAKDVTEKDVPSDTNYKLPQK